MPAAKAAQDPGPDVTDDLMAMLKRRGYLAPAYELYGGLAGFYDFGPLGSGLKRNVEDAWRRFYVLGEGFLEIQCPTIAPEPVFRASGHLASFQDPLVECGQCGANLRADHLLDAKVENAGALKLPQLDAAIAEHKVKCPECGAQSWGPAHHFNLMFRSPVGPGARAKDAYLRPETAQGMFVNFAWLYRFAREKLPFGAVQLGKAYRNEIAPRQGLLRLREFHQMEAEVFVHPQRKDHPRFADVERDTLPLVPAQGRSREEVKAGQIVPMQVGDAVTKGIIGSQALAYYLWLTHRFLNAVGVPGDRLRFRQHAKEEMAHYSSDTWDCEFLSPRYGWVEIVGIADRGSYDLTRHGEVSGQRLAHFERYPEPREVEVERVVPDKPQMGKRFKGQAGVVMQAFQGLSFDRVRARDGQPHPLEGAEGSFAVAQDGTITLEVAGQSFAVPPEAYRVERVKERVAGVYVVPHVIEPSYGVDRILYAVLESSYRPAGKGRDWATLALPPSVAPVSVGVFPLMARDRMDSFAANLEEDLRRSGVQASYDDGGAIGRRYARMDEVGTPFCVTVDYDTLEDGTVTLRERDSGAQKRVPARELLPTLQGLLRGERAFRDLSFPDVSPSQDAEGSPR